ncbi:MAG TPA: hypothetical protein VIH90_06405 [Candidatus Saccharimonadales bacterium]
MRHKNYIYDKGYIVLNISLTNELPKSITIKGHHLSLKSEFHISLINAGKIAQIIDQSQADEIEKQIVEQFNNYSESNSLDDYKLLKKYRFVERDVRKTVIEMVEVANLYSFFDQVKQTYGVDIPYQPTHVTLYTLQPEKGIGILSEQELSSESKPVDIKELALGAS